MYPIQNCGEKNNTEKNDYEKDNTEKDDSMISSRSDPLLREISLSYLKEIEVDNAAAI